MSDSTNSDLLALRREARRKKILNNSENRLRSITGRGSDLCNDKPISDRCFQHSNYTFESGHVDGDDDYELPKQIANSAEFANLFSFPEDVKSKNERHKNENESVEFKRTYLKSIVESRVHYIVLPIITQLLYLLNLGFLFYNNLFCPFITLKAIELASIQELIQIEKPNCLKLLASLTKGSLLPSACNAIFIVLNIISDFFLYIFCFVISHTLFNAVKELYFT